MDDDGGFCHCPIGVTSCAADQQAKVAALAAQQERVLAEGGIPRRYSSLTSANWPGRDEYGDVLPLVEAYLAGAAGHGWWLVISGPPRQGKTTLAAITARQMLMEQWQQGNTAFRVGWVRPDPLQQRLQADNYRDEAKILAPLYATNSLVVIDDLGELTGPVDRKLAMVLKHRWEWQLPTVVTTMLTFDDIELRYGGQGEVAGVGQAVGEAVSWRIAAATNDKRFFISLG